MKRVDLVTKIAITGFSIGVIGFLFDIGYLVFISNILFSVFMLFIIVEAFDNI